MTKELADNVKQFPDVEERFGNRMKQIEINTGAGLMAAQDFDFSSLYKMAIVQQKTINALVQLVGEMGEALEDIRLCVDDGLGQHKIEMDKSRAALTKAAPIAALARE